MSPTGVATSTRILALLVIAASLLGGCSTAGEILGSLDRPTARLVGAEVTDLHADGLTLAFDVEVRNPYSVALPLAALDVALSSAGTEFVTSSGGSGGLIPARRSARVIVPAEINFVQALAVLGGVRPGSVVPYRADVGVGVDLPGGERVTVPIAHEGEFPIPVPPSVEFHDLHWEELTLQRARGTLVLGIANPNEFAATIRSLDYALSLGGAEVAQATLGRRAELDPGEALTVEVPLSFSTVTLGTAAFQAIAQGEVQAALSGRAVLGTPFGALRMPVNAAGRAAVRR